jgi:flavin reductase (DIM6/NTAB) family NADH-FMN oxidoreductase RutF
MVTPDLFRQVMSNWGSGVTVVTTNTEGHPYGLTVSSFASVSLDPILILVCLDNRLSGLHHFTESKHFGVSILSESQQDISRMFAKKGTDRPPELYFTGTTGVPLLRNSLAVLECEVAATYPGGDHTIFLGRVQGMQVLNAAAKPLLYLRGSYQRLI